MVRPAKSVLIVLLLAGLCLPASAATSSQKPRPHGKTAKPKVETPAPAPAPPPPTPGQLPPSAPQVSFRDGLLTVNAQNSTLADVLAGVRAQTGATIDLPAGSGSERVFFHQGPAPARDILAALLKGSSFDYIILGPPDRPGDVQRVLLMLKPRGAESVSAEGTPPPSTPMTVRNADPDLDEGDDGPAPEEAQPQPYQPPPQPEPVQPTPNQPKTPQELLEELRQQQQRLQQQQQQQQRQQQSPPPQPPDTEPQ